MKRCFFLFFTSIALSTMSFSEHWGNAEESLDLPLTLIQEGKQLSSKVVKASCKLKGLAFYDYGDILEFVFPTSKGLRQDFLVLGRISSYGEDYVKLRVRLRYDFQILHVSEKEVVIRHVLSDKKIVYAGLRVFDSYGNVLPSFFVGEKDNSASLLVKDLNAKYPIYIDPTYLDEDWESISPNFTNGVINCVDCTDSGVIYAGGAFTLINNVSANRIAKYYNSQWQPMGQGFNNTVYAVLVLNNVQVCAGGAFTNSGGNSLNRISLWNGYAWKAMDTGFNEKVYALAKSVDGKIFAGGSFTRSGNGAKNLNHIAFWNGSYWDEPSLGVGGQSDYVLALSADSIGNIYVGGKFQYAGGVSASNIARWNINTSTWHRLSNGVNGIVNALAVDSQNRLYVGGEFTSAGGNPAYRVAVWNGTSWSSLGTGVDGAVYALEVSNEFTLFVGGGFNYTGGGIGPNHLGWWHRGQWNPITSGIQGSSFSIRGLSLDSGSNLYVAGSFYGAGGIESYNIAKLRKPPLFEIRYISGGGGIILGQPVQQVMRGDNGTEVVAQPLVGFQFDRWSDGLTSPSRIDTNITSNVQLTAYFLPVGEGVNEGSEDGTPEGLGEGEPDGIGEGIVEGEGISEGVYEGEGENEGIIDGELEGSLDGIVEGLFEGTEEGQIEGVIEGSEEGSGGIEGEGGEGVPNEGELEGSIEGENHLVVWIDAPSILDKRVGESLSLLARTSGGIGDISFQWYYKDTNNVVYRLDNQIQPLLYIENLELEDTGYYWCEVSDTFSVVPSNEIYVRVSVGLETITVFSVIILASAILYLFALVIDNHSKRGEHHV